MSGRHRRVQSLQSAYERCPVLNLGKAQLESACQAPICSHQENPPLRPGQRHETFPVYCYGLTGSLSPISVITEISTLHFIEQKRISLTTFPFLALSTLPSPDTTQLP